MSQSIQVCSQWHYCGGSSQCPDCPSITKKQPLQYTSVLLPSGRNRKVKLTVSGNQQFDLFGGAQ